MPQRAGNVDLYAQPKVKNADGSISTVDSRSYNFDGKEVLLPSVTPDGRHLRTDADIIAEYRRTGRQLGEFATVEDANRYAEQLHNDYAAGKYDQRPGSAQMPQIGEVRTSGGETRSWNGSGWVMTPDQTGAHEPDTFWGGAIKHFVEDEPTARNALLGGAAMLTGTAPLVAAAPLVGRGMSYLSNLLRGGNPLPKSGGELVGDLAGDVVQGGLDAYGGNLVKGAARGVGALRTAAGDMVPNAVRSLLKMNPKMLAGELATSGPVLNTIEHIGETLTPSGFKKAVGEVAEGLTPGTPSGRYVRPREVPYRMETGPVTPAPPKPVTGPEMYRGGGYQDIAPAPSGGGRVPYNTAQTPSSMSALEAPEAVQGGDMFRGGNYGEAVPAPPARVPYNTAPADVLEPVADEASMDVLRGQDMYRDSRLHGSSILDDAVDTGAGSSRMAYPAEASPVEPYQGDFDFTDRDLARVPESMRSLVGDPLSARRYGNLMQNFGGGNNKW